MFDQPYLFRKSETRRANTGNHIDFLMIYTFDVSNERYIVEVEHYKGNFYILKYYPKRLKNYRYRFNILTSTYVASRIIATCLRIIEQIINSDKYANFGFVGSPTVVPHENWREGQGNTKRFRIYKYSFESYFGHESFTHYMNQNSSVYLIINNKNGDPDDLIPGATEMFLALYPELLQ